MTAEGHTGHGKWSQPGVPHKGWSCVEWDDLGSPSELCEMCESTDIRYVHYMQHPNYPETLAVGCVCAEGMEEDVKAPREREKKMQSMARRRASWARRSWRFSESGSPYVNAEGYNITLFQSGGDWKIRVSNRMTRGTQVGRKTYPDLEAAKLAALCALLWAKERLP